MMTTTKIAPGYFDVLWNGEPTEFRIVNGSLGQSGKEPNMYGIEDSIRGTIKWHGSIQRCKGMLKFTFKMRNR